MDEVSLRLIIPDSKLWLHSRERARFYRKINCIPSEATHGACTKIFWNLIDCTYFYDAEISWLLRLNLVMNKWMRERVRKEKYYRQEEHEPELYRNTFISKKMVQLPVLCYSTKQYSCCTALKWSPIKIHLRLNTFRTHKFKRHLDVMTFNSYIPNWIQPEQPSWYSDVPETVVILPAEERQHISSPDGPDRRCGSTSPTPPPPNSPCSGWRGPFHRQ
jgi:hypothetical protein